MTTIKFHSNGMTTAFNGAVGQVPELQESWFITILKELESDGWIMDELIFELPNGQKAKPFKVNDNWNFSVEP